MNYQRLHNLFFGENSREANRIYHLSLLTREQAASLAAAGLVDPDIARVWGPDISHWDHNVTLSVSRGLGADFVFIKGLDGSIPTRYFPENRARAISAGLLQAPYCWLYRNQNVPYRAQASAADALLKQYPADLPAVVDFEWTRWLGGASNPNYSDLDLWVTEFLRLGNRPPILYSSAGYMNQFGPLPGTLKGKFSGFWFANYATQVPLLPTGFFTYDFWQFTSSGDAAVWAPNDGGKLECDLNYWNGSLRGLYTFAGVPIPQPPPNGGDMYKGTTNQVAKIWDLVGSGAQQIDSIPTGVVVVGDAPGVDGYVYLRTPGYKFGYTKKGWLTSYSPVPVTPPAANTLPDLPWKFEIGDDVNYEKISLTGTLKAKK